MRGIGMYDSDSLKIKDDDALIAESITRILMTIPNERVGRPDFGCNLRKLLFESIEDIFVADVRRMIANAIDEFEPRINLQDISVDAVGSIIYITIKFQKIGNPLDSNILEFAFTLEG